MTEALHKQQLVQQALTHVDANVNRLQVFAEVVCVDLCLCFVIYDVNKFNIPSLMFVMMIMVIMNRMPNNKSHNSLPD